MLNQRVSVTIASGLSSHLRWMSIALFAWITLGCEEPLGSRTLSRAQGTAGSQDALVQRVDMPWFDDGVYQDAGQPDQHIGIPTDASADAEGQIPPPMNVDMDVPRDAFVPDMGANCGVCNVAGVAGDCMPVSNCVAPGRPIPGHCPGPANIQCCVPANELFQCDPDHMEILDAPIARQGDPGCPQGMISLGDFCIDQFEASLLFQGHQWSPYHNPGDRTVVAVSSGGHIPQGYINGNQAQDACARAGKRLCTSDEWLSACQGDTGRTYPYGHERIVGLCNDERAVHPAVELFPHAENPFALIQDPCINQLPNGLSTTGGHPDCRTPEDVVDLMGNLHEWVADPNGTFRGGYYVDTRRNGPGCLYRTTAHDRSHWDYSTGFRCCADR